MLRFKTEPPSSHMPRAGGMHSQPAAGAKNVSPAAKRHNAPPAIGDMTPLVGPAMNRAENSAKKSPMRTQTGFTLIELMVTIAVVAILLTVGVPSFRSLTQNNRMATQANELMAALTLARSEAVKRGASVTVCSSTDQASCAGSNNWATGWIVFADSDADATVDGGDTIVRTWAALTGGSTLSTGGGGATSITFQSSGLTNLGANVAFALSTSGCTGTNARTITVIQTGRATAAAVACP